MEGVHLDSFIIIIFGASGSGKTSLMEMLMVSGGQYSVHEKALIDRHGKTMMLNYDAVQIFNVNDYDYVYETYGFGYGIQRKQIDKALEEIKHHFILCNDIATIKKLKSDYGDVVKTIFMFFDAPNDVLLDQISVQINIEQVGDLWREMGGAMEVRIAINADASHWRLDLEKNLLRRVAVIAGQSARFAIFACERL